MYFSDEQPSFENYFDFADSRFGPHSASSANDVRQRESKRSETSEHSSQGHFQKIINSGSFTRDDDIQRGHIQRQPCKAVSEQNKSTFNPYLTETQEFESVQRTLFAKLSDNVTDLNRRTLHFTSCPKTTGELPKTPVGPAHMKASAMQESRVSTPVLTYYRRRQASERPDISAELNTSDNLQSIYERKIETAAT